MPDTPGDKSGKPDFHEEMDRFEGHMPDWAGRNLKRLRHPRAVWVRVPAGVALAGGGVLSVLPGLGLWMLPVGLALLAHDVPVMRRPLARVLRFTNVKIEQRRERRQKAAVKRAAARAAKPAKPAAKSAVKPAPKPVTKPAPKPATKAAPKPAPKPVAKAKTAAKTVAKPAAKTASKNCRQDAPKTAPKPAPARGPKA